MKTTALALAVVLATTGASFAGDYSGMNTWLTFPQAQSQQQEKPVLESKRFIDATVTNSTSAQHGAAPTVPAKVKQLGIDTDTSFLPIQH